MSNILTSVRSSATSFFRSATFVGQNHHRHAPPVVGLPALPYIMHAQQTPFPLEQPRLVGNVAVRICPP